MSDRMRPISFESLMNQILDEYKMYGTVFNVAKLHVNNGERTVPFAKKTLENPVGIAAGPQSQLAVNVVACVAGGARLIELKTVQILAGENLHIDKPCIRCDDEGYNVEWSTELTVREAAEEYIKAWFASRFILKEFGLGNPDGLQFNMSVGYDLKGIKSESVDSFLNTLNDATGDPCFKECQEWLLNNLDRFENVTEQDILSVPTQIANTCTLSTMHGCPADEIERIAEYLIKEKHLNTFIKCNPTLLGYDKVRELLDQAKFDYIKIDEKHFREDLQFVDAIPMIKRLQKVAEEVGVYFSVKLSNTMPVDITQEELPGTEMYMSGRALFPLTISLAKKIADEFDGNISLNYCGGADPTNIAEIYKCGIYPITVSTVLLRTPGMDGLMKLADILQKEEVPAEGHIDLERLASLCDSLATNAKSQKSDAMRKKYDKHVSYKDAPTTDKLVCRVLCKNCIKVCPNRANETLNVDGKDVIMHVDTLCNECANCRFFCVEPCLPYRHRLTVFANKEDFDNSNNQGFLYENGELWLRSDKGIEKINDESQLDDFWKSALDGIRKQKPWLKF